MDHRAIHIAALTAAAFAAGWATGAVVAVVALTVYASWPWIRRRLESWHYVLTMAAP